MEERTKANETKEEKNRYEISRVVAQNEFNGGEKSWMLNERERSHQMNSKNKLKHSNELNNPYMDFNGSSWICVEANESNISEHRTNLTNIR